MQTLRYAGVALIGLAAIGLTVPAHAQFTQLSDASFLSASDATLNFSGSGVVASPFVQTAAGNTLTFTGASGPSFYLQPSDGSSFDFAAGTTLLETTTAGAYPSGPLIIDFSKGVSEFGLSAQNYAADTEAFSVIAYDGSTAIGGFSTDLTDNSTDSGKALFLGGSVTPGETITRLSISSVSSLHGAANDFLVGPVAFSAPVPEASTSISLALGLLVLGGCVLKARKRTAVG